MSEAGRVEARGLTGRAIRAGTTLAVLTVVENAVLLVRTLVLSRLLSPFEFGLMGIAFMSITLADVLSQTGFARALVQRRDDPEPYMDTVWSVSALRGLLLAVAVSLSAPAFGAFFRAPAAVPVVQAISLGLLINGLSSPRLALLERELRLGRHGLPRTAGMVVDLVVTTSLAFAWRSVWAMLAGYLSYCLVMTLTSYLVAPHRPRPRIDWERARSLYGFGKHVFRYELTSYLVEQVDRLSVGRLLDVPRLGLYTFAARMAVLPSTITYTILLKVAFPAFSRIQQEPERVREAFHRVLTIIVLTSCFIMAALASTAPVLISVLFGETWLPMTTAFRILCLVGGSYAIGQICGVVLAGIGRPAVTARAPVIRLVTAGALVVPATLGWGIEGAAFAAAAGMTAAAAYLFLSASRIILLS
ncbi:MAG TPA: oligosaccharide flippase family protein, partial [Candidatus Polarisedimenticolia bacterium]|nr:oligosaccharide flippase family protein [Candidatus Polarisedimenticolia bacterium]